MEANTIIKGDHSSYKTRSDQFNNLWIENIENARTYACPKNLNFKIDNPELEVSSRVFKKVLGADRLHNLHNTNERLTTNYSLSIDGKVMEVEFLSAINTTLSVGEIEALEKALKAELTFQINWNDDNDADFASISSYIAYETMLWIGEHKGVAFKFTTSVILEPPAPKHLR